MAIDLKYGEVILEHGTIAPDEPVVVLRARDRLLPQLLAFYRTLCRDAGSPQRHLDMIDDSRMAVATWQASHPARTPDSESSREWLDH